MSRNEKRAVALAVISCLCGGASYLLIADAPDIMVTFADKWMRAASIGLFVAMIMTAIGAITLGIESLRD